jgi:hypothetical protein
MNIRNMAVAAVFATLATASTAFAQELVLKRVMLSSGGVGYFEYEAEIDGNADLKLAVKLDQVDDVLKSLVVYDDKGGIGAIGLPGKDPLNQTFTSLPFGPEALQSASALLAALQGAEISIAGPRQLSGRVIGVVAEPVMSADGKELTTRHRVSLLTAQGVDQFILETAENLQFADVTLRKQVADALAAVQANRARDNRTFSIALRGSGKRLVRAAYLVGVPVWKASYRVTLPNDPNGAKAAVQGWAVLENMTGQDWKNVDLTLVSGRPVMFRQALYEAYYVDRPEVPLEILGRIVPRADQGEVSVTGGAVMPGRDGDRNKAYLAPPPPPAPGSGLSGGFAPMTMPAPPPQQQSTAINQALAAEAATQVSFHFGQPVSVGAGQTLTIPILDRELPVKRLSLYQPEVAPRNPLAALELKNDGDSGLPAGIVTIYERGATGGNNSYAGDARLAGLPAGATRLLTYAIDNKTIIEREVKTARRFSRGSFAQGIFQYTVTEQQTTTYRIKAPVKEGRSLLLEQPQLVGWTIVKPDAKTVTISENRWRIPAQVAAGSETVLDFVIERPVIQTMSLSSASPDQINVFLRDTEIDKTLRDSLSRLVQLQQNVAAAQKRVGDIAAKRQALVDDQNRSRENLRATPSGSDLYKRYLAKLAEQENAIEALDKERGGAEQALETARQTLLDYIAKLG